MSTRLALFTSLFVLGCGRSDLGGELLDGGAVPRDAGAVTDAGVTQRRGPLFVARNESPCPVTATEADLKQRPAGQQFVLVKTKAVEECTGAGGDWLIGAAEVRRGYFLGRHACWFFDTALRASPGTEYWGVARYSQTAASFTTPLGACLTTFAGTEPVSSDATVQAWGVYPSEADARAALADFAAP